MITAIASALHGNDAAPKGLIIAGHSVIYTLLSVTFFEWYGVLILPLCVAWWFIFRGSRQAKIELDCMDRINPPHPSYGDVLRAHYYTGILTVLALRFYNYDTKPHLINNGKFWDVRRPTEIATGLTGDIMMGAALWAITML